MNDRELLEWAAKAYANPNIKYSAAGFWFDDAREEYWNPLADDGDALRLAVKLCISVFIGTDTVEAYTSQKDGKLQLNEGDFYAATRRAIVRAAAELGKALQ